MIQTYLQEKTLNLIFNNQTHETVKNLFLQYFSCYGFSVGFKRNNRNKLLKIT